MFGHEDYKYKSNDLESRFEHNSLGGEECKLLRNWAPQRSRDFGKGFEQISVHQLGDGK